MLKPKAAAANKAKVVGMATVIVGKASVKANIKPIVKLNVKPMTTFVVKPTHLHPLPKLQQNKGACILQWP